MIVYPNSGNKITLVDYNTLEIVKQIIVEIPDSLQIQRMCLSTNHDYFIFSASDGKPFFRNYFISYNIAQDSVENIIATDLDSIGAPRITAAGLPAQPGLFYLYTHNVGLYSIDFITKKIITISPECGMPNYFYSSPNQEWIVLNKYFTGNENDYTELRFYKTINGLAQPDFILNMNDQDSVDVVDLVFSPDNTQIYISYLLSKRRAVYEKAFFGSYNLVTKQLHSSYVALPWSANPYQIAYSEKRREVYMAGEYAELVIIDTSTPIYSIKTAIGLPGKKPGPSEILITPNENVAFVSCADSDFIVAIDLDKRQVIKQINIHNSYLMMLL
ncbi:MAG TPA: hypothetical protein PLP19_16530 [bacterium]|nr:hypothetical protein [bacterium]HPN45100.1 hypothetical protein [bacterium]